MEMTEGLLFGNYFDVVLARVRDQLAYLSGRQRSAFRPNERMRFALERVLHIEGVHVQFEVGEGAELALDVIDGRNRAATYVVRDSAPTHRWPIDNLHRWNESVRAFATNKLFQRLHSVEGSGRRLSGNDHLPRIGADQIAFIVQRRRNVG